MVYNDSLIQPTKGCLRQKGWSRPLLVRLGWSTVTKSKPTMLFVPPNVVMLSRMLQKPFKDANRRLLYEVEHLESIHNHRGGGKIRSQSNATKAYSQWQARSEDDDESHRRCSVNSLDTGRWCWATLDDNEWRLCCLYYVEEPPQRVRKTTYEVKG